MYKTKEEFATAMSELLFSMRIESDTDYGDNDEPVPMDYANTIVDDPKHIPLIKKRIENSVLEMMKNNIYLYKNEYNQYSYTADTYDHAFAVDAYVDELFTAEQEAIEAQLEEARQARLKVRYVVRTEVERIELDPETGEEEFHETDSGETGGSFKSYDEAVVAQQKGLDVIRKGYF